MSATFTAIKEATNDGKIFSVTFVKRDGSIRFMICRSGVKKYRKTTIDQLKEKMNPNLITVFDMQKLQYRSFHQNQVLALKTKGITFNVIND